MRENFRVVTRIQVHEKYRDVKYLDEGCFCAAFRDQEHPSKVYLVLLENDMDFSKDILTLAKKNSRNPHLPYMKFRGTTELDSDGEMFVVRIYETRYSRELNSLYHKRLSKQIASMDCGSNFIVNRKGKVPRSLVQALQAIENACKQLGIDRSNVRADRAHSYYYDLAEKNFGVDQKNRLILRDPLVAS